MTMWWLLLAGVVLLAVYLLARREMSKSTLDPVGYRWLWRWRAKHPGRYVHFHGPWPLLPGQLGPWDFHCPVTSQNRCGYRYVGAREREDAVAKACSHFAEHMQARRR